jgi:hypothetical protein
MYKVVYIYDAVVLYAAGLKLSLQSPGCLDHRTVVHEAMHSLGFVHEQNREDRDYNVIVLLDNADPNRKGRP